MRAPAAARLALLGVAAAYAVAEQAVVRAGTAPTAPLPRRGKGIAPDGGRGSGGRAQRPRRSARRVCWILRPASAAMASHWACQLLPASAVFSVTSQSSSSRKARATASGYSIIATCPASGSVSSREPRNAAAARRAIRKETRRSRPP